MDPKQLALQLFDKAILAGFVVWLLLAVSGFVEKPAELSSSDALQADLKKIGDHMGKATIPDVQEPGWEAALRKQLDASTVPPAQPGPAWALEKRPGFLWTYTDVTPTFAAKHRPATDLSADGATRGQVVVRWKPSIENEYVLCSFEVYRHEGAEAGEPWEKVFTAGPGATEWIDSTIRARSTYFYKIVSIAEPDRENPVVVRYNLTVAAAEARKESEVCGPVRTARDVFVIPTSGGVTEVTDQDLIRDPNAKETASVKVYKWDPETSTFQQAQFNPQAGQPIGEKRRLRGARRDFDFTTGAVLDDCWIELRPRPNNPEFPERVGWIRIRFADGTTEEFSEKDKPEELGGG
jgi:hypothetical protein